MFIVYISRELQSENENANNISIPRLFYNLLLSLPTWRPFLANFFAFFFFFNLSFRRKK